MTRNLALTSPLMRGDDVRAAQHQLKKRGWLQGKIDGQFGPDTMRATKRAKYYMGYRLKVVNSDEGGVYGQFLHDLLVGAKKPRPDMTLRRRARLRTAAKPVPKRVKALAEARKWLGTSESPPGSNRVFFSQWYGLTGPWCAMFVTFVGTKVGFKQFDKHKARWAYCPYLLADARAGRNGVAITYTPKPGNIVLYDWDDDGIADHVGWFEKWTENEGEFWTIEGNTSRQDRSNGGNTEHNTRTKADVVAFVHLAEAA